MITLAEAKHFLRVDADDDDAVIERLIAAASDHLASIGVDMTATPIPPSVVQAQYLLLGHFYDHSELRPTDIGVDRLIAPHREHGV